MAGDIALLVNTGGPVLFFGTIAGVFSEKYNLPKMVPLIVTGIIISFFRPDSLINFADDSTKETALVIAEMGLLLVLYQEGMHLSLRRLQENLLPVLLLAVVGTIVTATITGFGIQFFAQHISRLNLHFLLIGSLLMASIVVPTDPAATFSILRSSGTRIKPNLEIILGGESTFNDVIAIMMVIVILLPQVAAKNVRLVLSPVIILIALWQLIGGILLGGIMTAITLYAISKINGDKENAALTLSSVFGIFALAPLLNVSSAIAALTAGLLLANPHYIGMKRKYTRSYMIPFWDKIVFLIEIFAFTFIGFLFDPHNFVSLIIPGILLSIIVLVCRIISVYLTTVPLEYSLRTREILSNKDRFFIAFAGFKGLTTAVLALLSYVYLSNVESQTSTDRQFSDVLLYGSLILILMSGIMQGLLLPFISEKMNVYDRTEPDTGLSH